MWYRRIIGFHDPNLASRRAHRYTCGDVNSPSKKLNETMVLLGHLHSRNQTWLRNPLKKLEVSEKIRVKQEGFPADSTFDKSNQFPVLGAQLIHSLASLNFTEGAKDVDKISTIGT